MVITNVSPQKADWHAVERDFRAGVMSLREMAKAHGVSHVRIKAHADAQGWTRDLKAKIQAKADELIQRREAAALTVQDERGVVDANAQVIANVRTAHRQDIARARALANALMAELEAQTFDAVLMGQLGELMRNPDDAGADRLNDIYRKVISTPGRVDTAKKLVEAMKTVISMEREAYSIGADANDTPANSIASFLSSLKRSALPVVYEVEADDSL